MLRAPGGLPPRCEAPSTVAPNSLLLKLAPVIVLLQFPVHSSLLA